MSNSEKLCFNEADKKQAASDLFRRFSELDADGRLHMLYMVSSAFLGIDFQGPGDPPTKRPAYDAPEAPPPHILAGATGELDAVWNDDYPEWVYLKIDQQFVWIHRDWVGGILALMSSFVGGRVKEELGD